MAAEKVEVKVCFGGEGLLDIGVEVDGQQSAGVVGTEWDLAAGVGGYGLESEVGVAVGERLACDGVPEEYAGFGRFPCVVDYLGPDG